MEACFEERGREKDRHQQIEEGECNQSLAPVVQGRKKSATNGGESGKCCKRYAIPVDLSALRRSVTMNPTSQSFLFSNIFQQNEVNGFASVIG